MDHRTSLAVETLLSLGKPQEWTPPSPATSSDCSEIPPGVERVEEEEIVVEDQGTVEKQLDSPIPGNVRKVKSFFCFVYKISLYPTHA